MNDDLLREAMHAHAESIDAPADSAHMLVCLGRADRAMSLRKTSMGVVAAGTLMLAGVAYLAGQDGTDDQLVVQQSPPDTDPHTTTSRQSATTISVPPVTSAPADPGGTGTTAPGSTNDPSWPTTIPGDPPETPSPNLPGPTPSPNPTQPPATTTTIASPYRCLGGHWLQYAYSTVMPFTNTFSGKAVPFTTITFTSPYVSGSTVADASGDYSITTQISGLTKGQTVDIYASCQGNTVYWPFEYR